MQRIGYILFRIFLISFSIIPFKVLYYISDIMTLFIFYVVSYRKKTVISNLSKAFPDKNKKEILKIAFKFYKNLCDIILESVKGFTVKSAILERRYKFLNPEISNRFYNEGRSIMFVGSHYGNWEWGTQVVKNQVKHPCIGFYKPMSNPFIDKYICHHRMKRGVEFLSIYETSKVLSQKRDKPVAFVMVGDQCPSTMEKAIWVNFLNQDTACLHGIENHSRVYNLPIVYIDVQRIKRGYYELTLSTLIENSNEIITNGAITTKYMAKLEEIILKKPENWLWSHKRWKHSKPEVGIQN
jgi:Kdo2-lipid IVA lauroyltransferase/acyltransferase